VKIAVFENINQRTGKKLDQKFSPGGKKVFSIAPRVVAWRSLNSNQKSKKVKKNRSTCRARTSGAVHSLRTDGLGSIKKAGTPPSNGAVAAFVRN
jgi:hypothetical protein